MAALTYSDFDLELERTGQGYQARVRSPAGEAQEDLASPLAGLDLEQLLSRIGRPNRGLVSDSQLPSPSDRDLKDAIRTFGASLFDRIFAGRVGDMFRASLDQVREPGKGLVIRLQLADAPELAIWPWELLFDSDEDDFVARSTTIPLVRYMETPQPMQALTVSLPMRILVIVASPPGRLKLDVTKEWQALKDSLKGLEDQGRITLDRLENATVPELQRLLGLADYHVIHFIGYGDLDTERGEGFLLMEGDSPQGRPLGMEELRTLLRDERQVLRLVVLNTCKGARTAPSDPFSGLAQGLTHMGIPAVVGMQLAITDDAATTFAQVFYSWVAEGYPIEAALGEARKAIFVPPRKLGFNELEWGIPVLFMRSSDGQIFSLVAAPVGEQAGAPDEQTTQPESPSRTGLAPSGRPETAAPTGSTRLRIDPGNPPIAVIRELMTDAFTDADLRRFCEDSPSFRPAVSNFGEKFSLADIVGELVTFCSNRLLWDDLLAGIKEARPGQYARFESRLYGAAPVSAGSSLAMAYALDNRRIQDWFVNRKKQRDLFLKMLAQTVEKQIMLVEAPGGMGKSWLINWLRGECNAQQVPVSHFNLEQLTYASLDYLGIVREARDQLGAGYFNSMTEIINASTSGGVSQAGQADDAIVRDNLGFVRVDSDQVRQQIKLRIQNLFFECLRKIPQRRVVFLVDAYEDVKRDAQEWIEGELLSRICRGESPNALAVIAGRQGPRLNSPGLNLPDWEKFVIPPPPKLTDLELLLTDDVAEYLRRRNVTSLDPKSLAGESGISPGKLADQVESALLVG